MDLQALIEPTLVGMGYELVTLERVGRGLLRVYIDQPAGIGLDDCEKVSRQLSRVFEVENIDYDRLEVSSPGLDRPLVKAADFTRFAGQRAQLKLHEPLENRKKWIGVLVGLEGDAVALDTEAGRKTFSLESVESARLAPEY